MTESAELALGALSRMRLFSGVDAPMIARVSRESLWLDAPRGLPAGAVGGLPGFVWLVAKGLLQVDALWAGGRQMIVDVAGPGDVFGGFDSAALPPVQVVPLVDSALVGLPPATHRRLLAASPAFARSLAIALARKLAESQRLRALFALPARRRLLYALDWLHKKLGPDIPLTRRALAEIVGVAPETAIRLLSPLEKGGVIRTRAGRIRVRETGELEALARD